MYDSIFSPSFGNRPRILVGRESILNDFIAGLSSRPGSRERARLLLGQRGSGKTVLLLEMAEAAKRYSFIAASPTIAAKGMLDRILEKLEESGEAYLSKEKRQVTGGSASVLGVAAGVQYKAEADSKKSFSCRLSHICADLEKHGKGALILIDEVQSHEDELKQLIIAYQEMVGEGRNIALVLAGLPAAVSSTINDNVLTLLNRAVKIELPPLHINEIDAFYQRSFTELDFDVSGAYRREAARETGGSPYLMQLIGHYLVRYAADDGTIDRASFDEAICSAKEDFKNDIIWITLKSLSDADVEFLRAMAADAEVSRISDIAERLGVSGAYAQIYRRRLRESGVIEQVRRGEIRFAIPFLRDYFADSE